MITFERLRRKFNSFSLNSIASLCVITTFSNLDGFEYFEPAQEIRMISLTPSTEFLCPGDIATVCVNFHNLLQETSSCTLAWEIPEGWLWIQDEEEEPLISAEEDFVIVAIKSSDQAAPGIYTLPVKLKNEHGDIVGSTELTLTVREMIAADLTLEHPPPYCTEKSCFDLRHRLTNSGNTCLPVRVCVQTDPEACCFIDRDVLILSPGEVEEIPMRLSFPQGMYTGGNYFVFISIYHQETGELLAKSSFSTELIPCSLQPISLSRTIPAHFSVFFLSDNRTQYGAFEFGTRGYLDEQRCRLMHLLVRYPTKIARNLYRVDQKTHFSIEDPYWRFVAGDAVYFMSPLTQRHRYGYGAGYAREGNFFHSNFYCIRQPLHRQEHYLEAAGQLGVHRKERFRTSAQVLYKEQKDCISGAAGTFGVELLPKNSRLYFEAGANFSNGSAEKNPSAYLVQAETSPIRGGWAYFEKTLAHPQFRGYVRNIDLTTTGINLPLGKGWRTGYDYNHLNQDHRARNLCEVLNSPEQRQHKVHLSYMSRSGWNSVLMGEIFRSKDLLYRSFDFDQHWVGCNLSIQRRTYGLLASANYGYNIDYLKNKNHRDLQRYSLYLTLTRWKNLSTVLLFESGHIDYFDTRKWRNGMSAGFLYRNERTSFEWVGHHYENTREGSSATHLTFRGRHQLRNCHEIRLLSDYYLSKKAPQPRRLTAMVEYCIPFGLPTGRREDIGILKGKILSESTLNPLSYAIVKVGDKRVMTDGQGAFALGLAPGAYRVQSEALDQSYYLNQQEPLCVRGGRESNYSIYAYRQCHLSVKLIGYQLPDDYAQLEVFSERLENNEDVRHLLSCQGGIPSVRITAMNASGNHIYTLSTDQEGEVFFENLPQGKWTLIIERGDIPEELALEEESFTLDLNEESEYPVVIHCYPKITY